MVAFCEEARRFCAFVRTANELALEDRVAEARARVTAVYAAGSLMIRSPVIDELTAPDDFDEGPSVELSCFGSTKLDGYSQFLDPYDDESQVGCSLDDDFGDICTDLQRGLRYWDAGYRADAGFHWQLMFDHWGRHAVGAIAALHEAQNHGAR